MSKFPQLISSDFNELVFSKDAYRNLQFELPDTPQEAQKILEFLEDKRLELINKLLTPEALEEINRELEAHYELSGRLAYDRLLKAFLNNVKEGRTPDPSILPEVERKIISQKMGTHARRGTWFVNQLLKKNGFMEMVSSMKPTAKEATQNALYCAFQAGQALGLIWALHREPEVQHSQSARKGHEKRESPRGTNPLKNKARKAWKSYVSVSGGKVQYPHQIKNEEFYEWLNQQKNSEKLEIEVRIDYDKIPSKKTPYLFRLKGESKWVARSTMDGYLTSFRSAGFGAKPKADNEKKLYSNKTIPINEDILSEEDISFT